MIPIIDVQLLTYLAWINAGTLMLLAAPVSILLYQWRQQRS